MMALGLQVITLSTPRYGPVLATALVLTALADLCFLRAFWVGGLAVRVVSVLLLLPTLFVVADTISRAAVFF